jgi:predicted branched-subunit amino acid permease
LWQLSTAIGIFIGAQVPPEWSLDFALPLTFIAIVIPMLKNRAYVVAAIVAAFGGVLAFGLPYKLGYVVASLAAIVLGFALEGRWKQR